MIKGLSLLMHRMERHFSEAIRRHTHLLIQEFVQVTLRDSIRVAVKKKKLQAKTLVYWGKKEREGGRDRERELHVFGVLLSFMHNSILLFLSYMYVSLCLPLPPSPSLSSPSLSLPLLSLSLPPSPLPPSLSLPLLSLPPSPSLSLPLLFLQYPLSYKGCLLRLVGWEGEN